MVDGGWAIVNDRATRVSVKLKSLLPPVSESIS